MSVGNNVGSGAAIKAKSPKKVSQRLLTFAALLVIYIFFCFFGRNFFGYETALNILDASVYIGFAAIGVTFVIISGGIDLSLGTVQMCAAMVGGVLFRKLGMPFGLALVFILLTGTCFGLFNGFLIAKLKLPAFIATLGTMMIAIGMSSIISNVQTYNFPARSEPAGGWFKDVFSKLQLENGWTIPTGAILLLVVLLLANIVLTKTKIGRYTYAIGSNEEAARLSGVNTVLWKTIPYAICGFCAGLAGISYACTYTTVLPGSGSGMELDAIAATYIGGASTTGGSGSVFGTIIGVFIMSCLRVGLPSMDLQPHYQKLMTGIVVIVAVLIDMSQQKKR